MSQPTNKNEQPPAKRAKLNDRASDSDSEEEPWPFEEGDIVKVRCSYDFDMDIEVDHFLKGYEEESYRKPRYVLCMVTEVDYDLDEWYCKVVPLGIHANLCDIWAHSSEVIVYKGRVGAAQKVHFTPLEGLFKKQRLCFRVL